MHVGIFETDHFEVAHTITRFFDNGKNTITLFTYKKSYDPLRHLLKDQYAGYNWIVKDEKESRYAFMQRIYREVKEKKIELLFLDTITNNHLLYAWMISTLSKVRVIVTLHDINSYFLMKPGVGIRRWIRYIGKKLLIRVVSEFNVISSTMVNYLEEKLPAGKKVYNIPGAFFSTEKYVAPPDVTGNTINIVVPGTADTRRRNYTMVFELLDQCIHLSIPVSIVLLGGWLGSEGKKIIEKCSTYSAGVITCYDTDIVDQPEFERQMYKTHFIFCPSVIDTVLFDNVKETYGISIASGNISDIIQYARPAILPAALKTPAQLESSIVRFNNLEDIITLLQQVKETPSLYQPLAENALRNSKKFTIERIREENPGLL